VQLFFIVSGFGLCCGYYERIKNNQISLNKFYNKRYLKILPYFALLVVLDVCISLILNGGGYTDSLVQAFSDFTLLYGFFPNSNIEVIGVGWTLGVIFGFYLLFPFFVYLIWTKKRAWFSLVISIVIYYVCTFYFTVDGSAVACNTARWFCYFIAGGMIYLYKDGIIKLFNKFKWLRWVILLVTVGVTVAWFFIPDTIGFVNISLFKTLIMFSLWLCYAISYKSYVLANPVTKFLSGISFEIYLAHMLIFRAVEKVHLTHIFESDVLSYIFVSIVVIIVVIAFAYVVKLLIEKTEKWIAMKYNINS
jgi:peptidoglycan/LPS O-acetylase OafA/YrhL